jgi:hypothetical protein
MATPIFTIEPNPHWVIIDNFSKLPNGAAIYTYRSLDPSTFKPAFEDPAGQIPFGQPIVGHDNGTMPPIYWEFDPDNPTDTYYIRVYDSSDPTTQNFLWDFNGLSGGGSGGGGTVVSAYDIENLVINGVFYRNIGQQLGTPSLPTALTIAPSNNAGFVNDIANSNVISNGPVGPDIIFAKNNTTASDSLDFPLFTPLGTHYLSGDVTPTNYFTYNCSSAGAGETYKYVQFPINLGVNSLSAQTVSVKIFARSSSSSSINLTWRMFFGSGGGSVDLIPASFTGTIALIPTTWQVFTFESVITPDATGNTLGSGGNDALFLQVNLPLGSTCNIDFVKPAVYLGSIAPGIDYHSYDMIDSIINTPRTGDVRTSLNNFLPGWVIMNDGTIGDAASNSTTRANIDTFPLFSLIWNLFVSNQTLAPMFTSAGSPIAYGASPISDFMANNQLSLTLAMGRVFAGISGSHAIGTSLGTETHTILAGELPPHTHTIPGSAGANFAGGGSTSYQNFVGSTTTTSAGPGSSTPISILQPTVYMNVFLKL